jgi:hypothetical protein
MPTMDPNEGSATGYSVSPSLPSGLVLSSITGSITGTPSVTQVAKTYTITTTNSGGSTTFTGLSIEVLPVPPSVTGYGTPTVDYTKGTTISTNSPIATGDAATAWTVSPTLPTGLAFSTSTGFITGTPTVLSVQYVAYSVTATNKGGSSSYNVRLKVIDKPPVLTKYLLGTDAALVYDIHGSASNALPTNTPVQGTNGGTPTQYRVSPALPAGVTLSSSTGAITGQPTAVLARTSFSVTAVNSGGSSTVSVVLVLEDKTTLPPKLLSPTDTVGTAIRITVDIPEVAKAGSVKITFTPTTGSGGTSTETVILTMDSTFEAGPSVFTAALPSSATIEAGKFGVKTVTAGDGTSPVSTGGLVNNATYTITLSYEDLAGNARAVQSDSGSGGGVSPTVFVDLTPPRCPEGANTIAVVSKKSSSIATMVFINEPSTVHWVAIILNAETASAAAPTASKIVAATADSCAAMGATCVSSGSFTVNQTGFPTAYTFAGLPTGKGVVLYVAAVDVAGNTMADDEVPKCKVTVSTIVDTTSPSVTFGDAAPTGETSASFTIAANEDITAYTLVVALRGDAQLTMTAPVAPTIAIIRGPGAPGYDAAEADAFFAANPMVTRDSVFIQASPTTGTTSSQPTTTVVPGLTGGGTYAVYTVALDEALPPNAAPTSVQVVATPDLTPPSFASTYPRVVPLTETSFRIDVILDGAGTIYYIVELNGDGLGGGNRTEAGGAVLGSRRQLTGDNTTVAAEEAAKAAAEAAATKAAEDAAAAAAAKKAAEDATDALVARIKSGKTKSGDEALLYGSMVVSGQGGRVVTKTVTGIPRGGVHVKISAVAVDASGNSMASATLIIAQFMDTSPPSFNPGYPRLSTSTISTSTVPVSGGSGTTASASSGDRSVVHVGVDVEDGLPGKRCEITWVAILKPPAEAWVDTAPASSTTTSSSGTGGQPVEVGSAFLTSADVLAGRAVAGLTVFKTGTLAVTSVKATSTMGASSTGSSGNSTSSISDIVLDGIPEGTDVALYIVIQDTSPAKNTIVTPIKYLLDRTTRPPHLIQPVPGISFGAKGIPVSIVLDEPAKPRSVQMVICGRGAIFSGPGGTMATRVTFAPTFSGEGSHVTTLSPSNLWMTPMPSLTTSPADGRTIRIYRDKANPDVVAVDRVWSNATDTLWSGDSNAESLSAAGGTGTSTTTPTAGLADEYDYDFVLLYEDATGNPPAGGRHVNAPDADLATAALLGGVPGAPGALLGSGGVGTVVRTAAPALTFTVMEIGTTTTGSSAVGGTGSSGTSGGGTGSAGGTATDSSSSSSNSTGTVVTTGGTSKASAATTSPVATGPGSITTDGGSTTSVASGFSDVGAGSAGGATTTAQPTKAASKTEDIVIALNEAGTVFWVAVPWDAPVPTPVEVVLGMASGGGLATKLGVVDVLDSSADGASTPGGTSSNSSNGTTGSTTGSSTTGIDSSSSSTAPVYHKVTVSVPRYDDDGVAYSLYMISVGKMETIASQVVAIPPRSCKVHDLYMSLNASDIVAQEAAICYGLNVGGVGGVGVSGNTIAVADRVVVAGLSCPVFRPGYECDDARCTRDESWGAGQCRDNFALASQMVAGPEMETEPSMPAETNFANVTALLSEAVVEKVESATTSVVAVAVATAVASSVASVAAGVGAGAGAAAGAAGGSVASSTMGAAGGAGAGGAIPLILTMQYLAAATKLKVVKAMGNASTFNRVFSSFAWTNLEFEAFPLSSDQLAPLMEPTIAIRAVDGFGRNSSESEITVKTVAVLTFAGATNLSVVKGDTVLQGRESYCVVDCKGAKGTIKTTANATTTIEVLVSEGTFEKDKDVTIVGVHPFTPGGTVKVGKPTSVDTKLETDTTTDSGGSSSNSGGSSGGGGTVGDHSGGISGATHGDAVTGGIGAAAPTAVDKGTNGGSLAGASPLVDCGFHYKWISVCTKTCGGGIQTLTGLVVTRVPERGGSSCPTTNNGTQTCNAEPCPTQTMYASAKQQCVDVLQLESRESAKSRAMTIFMNNIIWVTLGLALVILSHWLIIKCLQRKHRNASEAHARMMSAHPIAPGVTFNAQITKRSKKNEKLSKLERREIHGASSSVATSVHNARSRRKSLSLRVVEKALPPLAMPRLELLILVMTYQGVCLSSFSALQRELEWYVVLAGLVVVILPLGLIAYILVKLKLEISSRQTAMYVPGLGRWISTAPKGRMRKGLKAAKSGGGGSAPHGQHLDAQRMGGALAVTGSSAPTHEERVLASFVAGFGRKDTGGERGAVAVTGSRVVSTDVDAELDDVINGDLTRPRGGGRGGAAAGGAQSTKRETFRERAKKLELGFVERYGVLFDDFKPRYYLWKILKLSLQIMTGVLMSGVLLDVTALTQSACLMGMHICYGIAVAVFKPHLNTQKNVFEVIFSTG